MSKPRRSNPFFWLALVLCGLAPASAQSFEAVVRIERQKAYVEGRFLQNQANSKNFALLDSRAGADNLGARVSDVRLTGRDGERVDYKKLAASEYLADGVYERWSYALDLSPPANLSALAHVSSLTPEQGILMLGDLLPQFGERAAAKIKIELPAEWQLITTEKLVGPQLYEVDDVDDAVFVAGRRWRVREAAAGAAQWRLAVSGEWKFTDEDAARFAGEIAAEYRKIFGDDAFARVQINLVRFPAAARAGRWEAETRGATVTIFSADLPISTQSVQRLHEQLRHEIFHLWLPNGVNLAGNYDWFYEGFALYQSLRTAVALNRIRFDDYLDTLARAYDLDTLTTARTSLIEASRNRWSGANTQIYARGMLVAFLADVALLQASKGKKGLPDLMREIYRKHRAPAPREDGNAAVLRFFDARAELRPLAERYVRGAANIDWRTELEALGIEAKTENFSTKLSVVAKPGGKQKDLLDELGYNNWRKRSGN